MSARDCKSERLTTAYALRRPIIEHFFGLPNNDVIPFGDNFEGFLPFVRESLEVGFELKGLGLEFFQLVLFAVHDGRVLRLEFGLNGTRKCWEMK